MARAVLFLPFLSFLLAWNARRAAVDGPTGEPSPYILVRDRLEALIVRAVYYDLVELGVEDGIAGDSAFGVWSGGVFFSLGEAGIAEG